MKIFILLQLLITVFLLVSIAHDLSHKHSKTVETKEFTMPCDKFRSDNSVCDYYKEA